MEEQLHEESTVTVSREYVQQLIREVADECFWIGPYESLRDNLDADHPLVRLYELFDGEQYG